MALGRSLLEGMGLTKEQQQAIIDAHMETVEGLKKKAGEVDELKKQVKDLEGKIKEASDGTDWKAEYDKLKADTEAKETLTKVKRAYRTLLKDGSIDPDVIDSIMEATKFDGMKLDKDGNLHDADKLTEGIKSRWGKFVVTESAKPTPTPTPPAGGKTTRTREEIMAIKDTKERQKAIADNHELFGI